MPRTFTAAGIVALLALALGVTACGSSGGALELAPTTASTLAPPTTTPRSTQPAPVPTSSTSTTLGEFATTPNGVTVTNLTLRADGIGSYRINDPGDQVRLGLVSSLGPTTEPDDVLGTDRVDCEPTPSTVMHWGALQVAFVGDGPDATFVGYDLIGPPPNPGLTTTGGITVGQTYDQAATILNARPPVQQGDGALVLGQLGPNAPDVEIAGPNPTDAITRVTAGNLPTCDLPPDTGNYDTVPPPVG
jgi:hypothetical protein